MSSAVSPNARGEIHAVVVPVEAKVRHACERVGAVRRRRAARDDLDLRQQRRRNVVDVHAAVAIGGREARAVEQHERALRPHRAQIDDAATRAAEQRTAAALRALRLEELRQLIELICDRCAGFERLRDRRL